MEVAVRQGYRPDKPCRGIGLLRMGKIEDDALPLALSM